ncbi:WhiB family transcriptional regulator [Streptomyces fulvoviolaceus]|uniref:WhiB family transcriptional regulator n=1 Tax=Streptomyces fulvoviolaceus TaxID=285535 RepID=UPI0009986B0F|nr:WhiB family transcriptional regulator [Streptomyces fulvoviolaceus]MCT9083875.1 WhiB family transcriptional regulator [Streptomyces fulvoviolaceus]
MSVTGSCPPPRPRASGAARPDEEPADSAAWQTAAACAGLPPGVVFSKKVKEAAPALRACAGCPVRSNCEEIVAPADNWFDGVCGGRLWRRGRPVELPAHFLPAVQGGLRGGSVA